MRRTVVTLLCTVALLFLLWEAYAAIRWVAEAGTLAWAFDHFWSALQSDWMAKIVVSDHLFIAGTVLVALWSDAERIDWGVMAASGFGSGIHRAGHPRPAHLHRVAPGYSFARRGEPGSGEPGHRAVSALAMAEG